MSSTSRSWTLNGELLTTAPNQEQMNLLVVLRDQMGLQGTKKGCDTGECGACTVLVDGEVRQSCQLVLRDLYQKEVKTIEGLTDEERARYVKAFSRVGVGCGFCVPGLAMELSTQSQENPLMRKDMLKILNQHLCRCTGYLCWQDAIQLLHSTEQGSSASYDLLDAGEGQTLARWREEEDYTERQVEDLLAGEASFVDDLQFPNMLYGAVLFGPYARGYITELDLSPATGLAGIRAVLSANDLPEDALLEVDAPLVGLYQETQSAADVIALVAAEDEKTARSAISRIRARVEPLESLTNTEYLRQRGEEHLIARQHLTRGNVTKDFRESDLVVSGTWYTSSGEFAFLPLPSCVVVPQNDDVLHIYSSNPSTESVLRQVSTVLGYPEDKLEIRSLGKMHPLDTHADATLEVLTALLALRTGNPVKLRLNREETSRFTAKRPSFRMHISLSCDSQGTFTGMRLRLLVDGGGRAPFVRQMLQEALVHACGPYRIPSIDLLAEAVSTNNPNTGIFLDSGTAQLSFALEGAIDLLTERLQMDGWAVRYRNALQPGDLLPNGQRVSKDCSIVQSLEAVRDTYYRNIDLAGISCAMLGQIREEGLDNSFKLRLYIDEDEQVTLSLPREELDSELRNALLQIASQESGLSLEQFHVELHPPLDQPPETDNSPASMILLTGAVREAALQIKTAQTQGETLAGRSFLGIYPPPSPHSPNSQQLSLPHYKKLDYATQVVVLDPSSGRIRYMLASHDISRAHSPIKTLHQIEGAIHMGLGYALTEYQPLNEGLPQTPSLRQLGLIPPAHVPQLKIMALSNTLLPHEEKSEQSGAIGFIPVAPAIASAIAKRAGTRQYHLPMQETMTALAHRPPTPIETGKSSLRRKNKGN